MIRCRWLALLLLAACKSGPTNVVDLTIVADASVTPAMLAAVRTLTITAGGVESGTAPYSLPTGMPKQETVQLLPKVTSGSLSVTVTVTDGKGVQLASGQKSVTLTGKEVPLTVTLSMTAPPTVTVSPATAKLTVGKTMTFTADRAVTWSVMGGAAHGKIDAMGNYTAPLLSGTYTIVAADAKVTTATQTATVTVVDYGVELLVGQLGGAGELDGVGGAARFGSPVAVVGDGNGHLYIGDNFGCTLRKLDLASQAVTTIGGIPEVCTAVDGMLGTTALFGNIVAMTYDPSTNSLFVSEAVVALGVRQVSLTTGQVTSFNAGGTLGGGITGMAYDVANKQLYTVQRGAHVINKTDLTVMGGARVRFAGMPGTPGSTDTATGPATNALFNLPSGLAFDSTSGTLYVADTGNNEIRSIAAAAPGPANGATATVIGAIGAGMTIDGPKGTARFNAPRGLTLRDTNTLYVAEETGAVVRVVALPGTPSVVTLAGVPYVPPASGPATAPQLATDDPNGNGHKSTFGSLVSIGYDPGLTQLYVGDYFNSVIRSIDLFANDATHTIAGTGPAYAATTNCNGAAGRFWQIGSITTVGNTVYLADNGNATIRQYDLAADQLTTIAGTPGMFGDLDGPAAMTTFERPEGVFVDGNILYITDGSDSTLRAMDLTTKNVRTIAGTHLTQGFTDGMGSSARFGYPLYVVGDHMGHLYIADGTYPILRRYDIATGMVTTIAGDPNNAVPMDGVGKAATFTGVYGLTLEGGLLYAADHLTLRSITLDNYTVTTVAGGTQANHILDGVGTGARILGAGIPLGDGHGHVYFSDVGTIRRFDVATGQVTTVVGNPLELDEQPGPLPKALVNGVNGMALTPTGDILFEDAAQSVLMLLRQPPGP